MSHHEVDGGGGSGVGLHESASGLPGAEHEAYVPGHGDGNVGLAPGYASLAIKELRGWHHWKGDETGSRSKELAGFLNCVFTVLSINSLVPVLKRR